MNVKDEIDNQNKIREAWFLFSQDQFGLVRFICWFLIWLISIAIVVPESVVSLGNAYLVFTLSMMMEFFPSFSKYPRTVTDKNKKLNKTKKSISVFFLLLLTTILCYSFYLVFKNNLPPWHSVPNVKTLYLVSFFLVFVYLLINCIMGMLYMPQISEEKTLKVNQMYNAAENGALGNAQSVKRQTAPGKKG